MANRATVALSSQYSLSDTFSFYHGTQCLRHLFFLLSIHKPTVALCCSLCRPLSRQHGWSVQLAVSKPYNPESALGNRIQLLHVPLAPLQARAMDEPGLAEIQKKVR